jgi:hypothetical protein
MGFGMLADRRGTSWMVDRVAQAEAMGTERHSERSEPGTAP